MPDRVRGDLVAVLVKRVHVFDAFANLLARAAEADARIAPALVWAFIDVSTGVGDEIAAADKKGKVNAVAVLVQLCSKVRQLLPALQLGAVVEAHYDEVRWPIKLPRAGARAQSIIGVANVATIVLAVNAAPDRN